MAGPPDRLAMEGADDDALVVVNRSGDLDQPLVVYYSLIGTASNGVDYTWLPGFIEIPANAATAEIVIHAIPDTEFEPPENIGLSIEPSPSGAYRIGESNRTAITIVPAPPTPPQGLAVIDPEDSGPAPAWLAGVISPPKAQIVQLSYLRNGTCRLALSGAPGETVVIEVSTNLDDWQPLATVRLDDGWLEFEDPSAINFGRSFYRLNTKEQAAGLFAALACIHFAHEGRGVRSSSVVFGSLTLRVSGGWNAN